MTRLAIVAVTMLLGGEARAEDGKLLRWNMTAGQKWGVVLTQKVETETSFGDKPLKLAIDTTLDQDWHVTSVDEAGTATIEQAFRRIQVRMDLSPSGAEKGYPVRLDASGI